MKDLFGRYLVEIDERWEKGDGVVYRLWRFVPNTEWLREATLYKEVPVIILDLKARGGE